jgi:hypothetical protein
MGNLQPIWTYFFGHKQSIAPAGQGSFDAPSGSP